MQDRYEDEYDPAEDAPPPAWRKLVRDQVSVWMGAILALAIICGAGLWGYRLTQREAMAIPVIRAAQTEARVQPEPTAADEAAPTNVSSYDAGAPAARPAPAITFAPPPGQPSGEDVAMGTLSGETPGVATGEAPGVATGQAPAAPEAGPTPGPSAGPSAEPAPIDATALAPVLSRPAPARPANLVQQARAAQDAASQEQELAQRAAASAVQIQLGDYASRDQTEAEWQRIFESNDDILKGRALVVQPTISGGRRRFRLRAGPFRDQVEARAVCRALTARGQDCLVAVNG